VVVVAGEVTFPRTFELDHACAEVGEVPGGERPGHSLFQGDDGDAREGQVLPRPGHALARAWRTSPPPTMSRWISLVPS
jgi:hypothetical protein